MKQNCRAVTSPKKWTNKFVFLSWRLGNTWNLKLKFKFQVSNSFFRFSGEVAAWQFCFEIYWPLGRYNFNFLTPLYIVDILLRKRVLVKRWLRRFNIAVVHIADCIASFRRGNSYKAMLCHINGILFQSLFDLCYKFR